MSELETRLTRASAPAESHATQSGAKADTACDSLLGTVKSTFDPFKETFSSEGGTVHHVSEAVNSLASLQGMPSQLLNTGIAQIPLLDKMPGMPAATIGVPHLGTPHAHSHPPSSGFPLPSVGATIGSGCLSVLIGGIPAARVLDIGIAPTCGGITPYFDIQTGSSNTFIGGMRAARMGIDMTRHCNPMGHVGHSGGEAASAAEKGEEVASEAAQVSGRAKLLGRAGKAWKVGNAAVGPASGVATAADDASQGEIAAAAMMAAQTAADLAFMMLSNLMGKDPGIEPSMGTLLAGDPTVLIGGFPLPDSQMMWHGAKHGIGKKVRAKLPKWAQELACEFWGEPVSAVTGEVKNDFTDYETETVVPFHWWRHYRSGWHEIDGPLGYGFRHAWQHELSLLRSRAIYTTPLGTECIFEKCMDGTYGGNPHGYEIKQIDDRRFVVRHEIEGNLEFVRASATDRVARCTSHVRNRASSILHWSRNGHLESITQADPRGQTRRLIGFRYDELGRILDVVLTDVDGSTSRIAQYAYDANGCLATHHNALAATTRFAYDAQRRMTCLTDANGYSFFYRYDSDGRCVESRGEDGLLHVQFRYQPGRTIVTESTGGQWTVHYNEARTITRVVDPYGGTSEYVLGADGRIEHEIDSGGCVTHWLYRSNGRATGRLDRWGNPWPTKDELPILPNPFEHTVPATPMELQWGGVRHATSADTLPLPPRIAGISASAFSSSRCRPSAQRDAAGRVIARTDEFGRAEHQALDAEGNLIAFRDRDGCNYRYHIASWNLLESETDALGSVVQYRYSPKQEVTAIIDANGNESMYAYDLKGRLMSVMRHGVVRETYTYDEGDRLMEKRDGDGNILLRYEMGENGRYRRRLLASGETHTYEYDRRGNFTKASTDKFDVALTYDTYGRRTGDKRNGRGIEHVYSGALLHRTRYFDLYTVRYEYEADGCVAIHTPDGGLHQLQYTSDRQILLSFGNGTSVWRSFDSDGRCAGRLVWRDECPGEDRFAQYQYSATGELRRVVDSVAGTTEYHYDDAHRLIGASRDGREVRRFTYDQGGNLLSAPTCRWMRHTQGNRLATTSYAAYRYNTRNHLSEEIRGSGHRTTYHYNSMDLLVQVQWSDRDEVVTMEYDGLCRRIAKTIGDARTEYYWDKDRLAAETGPDGQLRIYVYPNRDALLPFMFLDYQTADAPPDSGLAYFVLCDQAGLPEQIQDARGREVWRASEVDPYGRIEVADGNTVEYDLRWPGHWLERETGLHYNRFRTYSPTLCRYLQSDPIGISGGINLYAAPTNPLATVDVLGLECHKCGASKGNHFDDCDASGPKSEKNPKRDRRQAKQESAPFLGEHLDEETIKRNKLDAARDAYRRSVEGHKLLKKFKKSFSVKTVASNGTMIASGYKIKEKLPDGFLPRERNRHIHADEMLNHANDGLIRYDLQPGLDNNSPTGSAAITHAEKTLGRHHEVTRNDDPIGVSRAQCGDCRKWYREQAMKTGKEHVVADPSHTRIYNPDGSVEIYNAKDHSLAHIAHPWEEPQASISKYRGIPW
ncbi:Rhs family protein [Burkholderia lata]|uniref:Rhs family protein n=1 Tax=Burkholderia lata (strain ATCC 17760 / DSM 23089 / LMG 22485 / NCIMB 9086 / R18194 / 383) TaxID=482957 RepID=A0A6P2VNY5_BURL3|nr:RHS repeat-associated core domain-containing protein [Burkholderia lata]VWC92780.1 Rhs family protein [Burkholderia lata]